MLDLLPTTNVYAQSETSGWAPPVSYTQAPDLLSYAPVLLCDGRQNTHLFWTERSDSDARAFIYYSTDASGNWSLPIDIIAAQRVDLLHAVITSDLRVHLIWVTGNSGDLVYTSTPLVEANDSRTWPAPRSIDSNVNVLSNVYSGGNMLYADSDDVLHLLYSKPNDSGGFANSLYYRRSDDNGDTWSSPSEVITIVAPEPSSMTGNLGVDDAGRVHVVWEVRSYEYQSFSQLGYVRSLDFGATWEDSIELATGSKPFGVAMASVYTFGADEVHLTWNVPTRLHRWSSDGGETWSSTWQIIDLGAAYGGHNKLAKDSAGTLHAVVAVGNGVYHTVWRNDGWGPSEILDPRTFDPHGQQLTVCQGNRLHVAYYDRTADVEIWYTSRTTEAPELARQAVSALPVMATPAPLQNIEQPITPITVTATPSRLVFTDTGGDRGTPTNSGAFAGALVGVASSGILVLGVIIARLSRRHR